MFVLNFLSIIEFITACSSKILKEKAWISIASLEIFLREVALLFKIQAAPLTCELCNFQGILNANWLIRRLLLNENSLEKFAFKTG